LKLQQLYADFIDSGNIKDHSKTLENCFVASVCVDWFSKYFLVTKQASIYIGKLFEKNGIFIPMTENQKGFQNDSSFYKLIEFIDFIDSCPKIIKKFEKEKNFGVFLYDFGISEEERNKMKETQVSFS
jgi:hypothetical protein